MIINTIAVGNKEEAFIEKRFKQNLNIIYSLDNNKGKTIIIQSGLYALGNEPIFPASFLYKEYYHYISLTLDNGNSLECCRHKDDFYLKSNESFYILNEVSELKRLLNKLGIHFPKIIKDGKEKMVDPVLLYQLFFVGQDDNKTSNIAKSGYYNKNDFIEMIYSINGIQPSISEDINDNDLKKEIIELQNRRKRLLKEQKIFKQKNKSSSVISLSIDKEMLMDFRTKTEEITNKIVDLSKERNRFLTKYNKTKAVLDQLSSLKKRAQGTKLRCSDCHSYNIEYISETEGFAFDISDEVTRTDIELSLIEKMDSYNEEIDRITGTINELQESMQALVTKNQNINYEDVLYYAFQISGQNDYDKELLEIDNKVEYFKRLIENKEQYSADAESKKAFLKKSIIDEMNRINKIIDPSSNNILDLFTKKDATYSGCEEAIYFLSRLYSIRSCLQHSYPIIMDHFRAGELSSIKEKIVLKLFKELSNQVIFTVTLKDAEADKYFGMDDVNLINYEVNESNHILSKKYLSDFFDILTKMKIKI